MKMKRCKSLSPEPCSSEEFKRAKLDETECEDTNGISGPHILDFSDDVLLNILKYLCPQDLLALSLSCQRLSQVVLDRTLWREVDFRATSMSFYILKNYTKFFHPLTTSLAMRGQVSVRKPTRRYLLNHKFIKIVKDTCKQLKELILEEYYLDSNVVRIVDFPQTLEKFSLKGCQMASLRSNKSYFFRMDLHMPNLTCLILSDCQWFKPHSLLVISKIPKLKELRLNSCHRLGECVAYASLATRFGFKTLEILDLRDTALGDSEVSCFSSTKTLTHLYLECPVRYRNSESGEHSEHQQRPVQEEQEEDERLLRQDAALQHAVYEDENLIQFVVEDVQYFGFRQCLISDRAICALGSHTCDRRVINNSAQVIVVEEHKQIFNNPNLKHLVVRNYPRVTNWSLKHLALNVSSLEYLDVTGTSVTKDGVETFKSQKPNVKIVSSFDEI